MKFKLRRYYLYYLGRVIGWIVSLTPPHIGLALAALVGRIAFLLLGRYRRAAIENLKRVYGGGMHAGRIEKTAAGVFENLARNAFEWVRFPLLDKRAVSRLVRIRNIDIIDNALKTGRGALVITAHFGNWELVSLALRARGYHGAAIGRRIYFDRYNRYLVGLRRSRGIDTIYRDESPKKILKVLKDNGIIGILADQDVDSVDGVFVDFFGRPAYTPSGPVALAKASGASLIPAFMIRKNGRHELVIEKPVELVDTGDRQSDLAENTRRWSAVVESYIRRYPEQWVWIHRRWKTEKNPRTGKGRLTPPRGKTMLMKQAIIVIALISAAVLFAPGCAKKEAKAPEAKKEAAAGQPAGETVKQKVLAFNLEGLSNEGAKKWEVRGESAQTVSENEISLDNITAKAYGEEVEATLTADKGVYDKSKNSVRLQDNIKMTIENTPEAGARIADFSGELMGAPKAKEKKAAAKMKTLITCDGQVEFDYEKNYASFVKDVKVSGEDGDINADRITVYLEPQTKKIKEIVAEGNVRIKRGENITYSEKATYIADDKKVVLTGKPRLVIYQEGEGFEKQILGN